MSYAKKISYSRRSAICSIIFGCLIAIYPVFILKNISFSFVYLSILTTFSALNILSINRKTNFIIFPTSASTFDDSNKEKVSNKRLDNKEFSFYSVLIILVLSILVYAVISILLGAPVYEEIFATLYFSSLMTLLTVYPLAWYFFFCDSITAVLRVFTESKFESILESHFRSVLVWTLVGAWVGAFPIPLDWDRPWQKWPITCCIGASVGNSIVHFITGSKLIYTIYQDKRKVMLSRSV